MQQLNNKITATILRETSLPLPSASGVEIVDSTAYVIADDAPFLYQLNAETLALTAQTQLFETDDFADGRLPKKLKPDLEALTACTWPERGSGLLLLGSGSKPRRQVGYWLPLPAGAAIQAQPLDLQALYDQCRAVLPPDTKLNIEAAASSDNELLLLQRNVGAGAGGVLLRFGLAEALAHLAGTAPAPAPVAQAYQLPEIDGCAAGFSGATVHAGRLWVTASVEITDDPVLDGELLGSFVGVLDLATAAAQFARLVWADGRPYRGKVEGLAWQTGGELLLVTDDDAGGSTALRVSCEMLGAEG